MADLYHGGVPGLNPGDLILPPDRSGTNHTLSQYARPDAPHGTRTDLVYLTPISQHARVFAAFYPDGALYRVMPVGGVIPDPDAPDSAVMAAEAVVLEVVRPRVVFAHRTAESWIRLLTNEATR